MTVAITDTIVNVIAIDIPKQIIVVGNIERNNNGVKITSKSTYKIIPNIVPFALQALGSSAYIVIDLGNIIHLTPVEECQGYTNYHRSVKVSGMILDSIDGVKKEILFKQDSKGKIYFRACLDPKAQANALSLLGKPCTFYLLGKAHRAKDNFKTVVDVTE